MKKPVEYYVQEPYQMFAKIHCPICKLENYIIFKKLKKSIMNSTTCKHFVSIDKRGMVEFN